MDLQLRGKTAIVTGGSRGIGAGCCTVLAEEGCNVVINYRSRPEEAEAFAAKLSRENGVKCIAVKADVFIQEEVDTLWETAIKEFGTVDILINNANGGRTAKGPFETLEYDAWRQGIDGCLNIAFVMSSIFVKHCFENNKKGHIVNVLSKSCITTNSVNNTNYIAGKGGLLALTRGMANELTSKGIIVNGIVPGYVQTERAHAPGTERYFRMRQYLPTGEFGTPRDMGNVAAFLCSPCASQIIGAVVDCTGGTML